MRLKLIILCLSVFSLMACASKAQMPETYYYLLDTTPERVQTNTRVSQKINRHIKVLPVFVPDYMNQPNLVIKLSDHQIKITNYHFWAEDLRHSIQRILINELNQRPLNTGFTEQCSNCAHLLISINHFYPTEDGEVILSGAYEIHKQDGQQIRTDFRFIRALEKGGYDESVNAMRQLLHQLSQAINI